MKIMFKVVICIIVILFFSLYFSKYSNFYYYENRKVLTDEAMEKFEKDLKAGKTIKLEDYIPKEKDYNNKASRLGLKTSNLIDKCFTKSLKLFAKYLSKLENS